MRIEALSRGPTQVTQMAVWLSGSTGVLRHDSGALEGMARSSVPLAEHGQVCVTDTAHVSVSQGPVAETVGQGIGQSPGPKVLGSQCSVTVGWH